jgi:hypothetical protein
MSRAIVAGSFVKMPMWRAGEWPPLLDLGDRNGRDGSGSRQSQVESMPKCMNRLFYHNVCEVDFAI